MTQGPAVSVIVPCRNEATYIRQTLDALAHQDYPAELLELLVVDGNSDDRTREIAEHMAQDLPVRIRVFDNPARRTPHALNIGIREARGDIVMLMGAHSVPAADYVSTCVTTMAATGAACVGGLLETVGATPQAKAIAAAQASPFGVGNARFRTGASAAGPVDTVAFAAYRRDIFDNVGLFDEELARNQDDEFNFRLIQAGHVVWLDPEARVTYHSRADLKKLARQYFEYGFYKVRVIQKRGAVPSARQLAPPVFTAALLTSAALALTGRRKPLAALLGPYAVIGALAAGRIGEGLPTVAAAFVTMHLAYGLGFLKGLWTWRSDASTARHCEKQPSYARVVESEDPTA